MQWAYDTFTQSSGIKLLLKTIVKYGIVSSVVHLKILREYHLVQDIYWCEKDDTLLYFLICYNAIQISRIIILSYICKEIIIYIFSPIFWAQQLFKILIPCIWINLARIILVTKYI